MYSLLWSWFLLHCAFFIVEIMKTASMETVSTGVLDENKEHYLRGNDKAEKKHSVFWYKKLHMSKYQKNEDLQSNMWNLQPHCWLKVDFQKVDKHTGGTWLIHDTKRHKDNQLQSLKLPCTIFEDIFLPVIHSKSLLVSLCNVCSPSQSLMTVPLYYLFCTRWTGITHYILASHHDLRLFDLLLCVSYISSRLSYQKIKQ